MQHAIVLLVIAGATVTPSWATTWHVSAGNVRVTCPMTIGGSFEAKTTSLSGALTSEVNGSKLDGTLDVDLRTLDTGISLRNDHLRETYLEVGRGPGFDTATLSQIDLQGFRPEAPDGKRSFAGSLTLHGITKTVTGTVDVQQSGTALRAKASFVVHLPDYDIAKPRYLGVGVTDTVRVEVAFDVTR
jgi:polyisoprenoid-binding protein YceI